MSNNNSSNLLTQAAQNYWSETVRFALEHLAEPDAPIQFAEAAHCSVSSATQKIQTVRFMLSLGFGPEQIIATGQHDSISRFQQGRREIRYTEKVRLTFHVFGSLAERIRRGLARLCHDEECALDSIAEALESADPHVHSRVSVQSASNATPARK